MWSPPPRPTSQFPAILSLYAFAHCCCLRPLENTVNAVYSRLRQEYVSL